MRQVDRAAMGLGRAGAARACEHRTAPTPRNGEFYLEYQPKLDLVTGRIFGVEALMRWHHPVRGMLAPDEFIPQAEKAGTITHFGTWALQESCRQARLWDERREFSGSVAVNVSALQLSQPRFADIVCHALERHRVDPARLILEVTESCAIPNPQLALKLLTQLDRVGVRTSLDDFGTGHSSLASLRYLPISEVKVDRCFTKNIAQCKEDVAIVAAIIAVAKAKGASIVAEGVETSRQLAVLARMGCTAVQGYLIGRPMGPADLVRGVGELERRRCATAVARGREKSVLVETRRR